MVIGRPVGKLQGLQDQLARWDPIGYEVVYGASATDIFSNGLAHYDPPLDSRPVRLIIRSGGSLPSCLSDQLNGPGQVAVFRVQGAYFFHPGLSLDQITLLDRSLNLLEVPTEFFPQFTGSLLIPRIALEPALQGGDVLTVLLAQQGSPCRCFHLGGFIPRSS